ncbi:MAG: hypothetical protein WCH99_06555 [Verrucomicrobiota bacterium]
MSEFKFACPVCGQHMKCDVSDGGSVMECPTCFQKIAAPQAPMADSKFILTGTKVSGKKTPVRGADPAATIAPPEKESATRNFLMVLAVCLAAGTAILVFHLNKKPAQTKPPPSPKATAATNASAPTNPAVASPPKPKPPPGPPPASDKNWTLSLEDMTTPNSTVVGRIHGRDFILNWSWYQNGELMLRGGTNSPIEFGARINFSGAAPEVLANKTINVSPDVDQSAVLTLLWREEVGVQKQIFKESYALRLQFGALTNNRLAGKIYLCTPDPEKSYLMGKFNATILKPKPKAPAQTTNAPAKKK